MAPVTDFRTWITHAQSPRVERMLKAAANSNMISYAGGLPADEMFPVQQIEAAFNDVIGKQASEALQYNWSEGYAPLREQIAARMRERGIAVNAAQVLVTNGAQQALDLLAKLLLHPGDPVALENPTYVPAIQVFELQHAKLHGIDRDEKRFDFNALVEMLQNVRPKLLYTIPTGHNPTGTSLDREARERLINEVLKHETVLIEDDAYGELQYDGHEQPLRTLTADERIVFVGSFSKILSPGLRVGWIAASEKIIKQLSLIKQASDLQTSTVNQLVLSQYLAKNSIAEQVEKGIAFYRERRDAMLAALERNLPPGFSWTRPDSAFSVWLKMPEHMHAESLLAETIKEGVAFEPGKPFFVQSGPENMLRLSYSNQTVERINEGIAKLADIFRKHLVNA